MKKLIFNGVTLEAEQIFKGEDSIIGISNGVEIFSFKGISDFTSFVLESEHEFDSPKIPDGKRIEVLEQENIAIRQENKLLKAQNQALMGITEFHEEVLAEIILKIHS